MIRALRKDQELIDDVLSLTSSDELYIWWLGQSGYLLQYNGKRLLIDPYLSDSLTLKYANTTKPHVRISERVVDPSLLPCIDVVSSSHLHTDHMDAATIKPILVNNPDCKILVPEANRQAVAERLSMDFNAINGINDGTTFEHVGFQFRAIPAAHNEIERDNNGNCHCLGYLISVGPYRIYHSGDTLLYGELQEHIENFKPHLAFLPINGNDPSRGVAGNLNAQEAIELCKRSAIPLLIPCHYDLFEFNTTDVREFVQLATEQQQQFLVLELGGKLCGKEIL